MTVRVLVAGLAAWICLLAAGCGDGAAKGPSLTQEYQTAAKLSDASQRSRRLAAVAEKQQKAGDIQAAEASLSGAKEAAAAATDQASKSGALVNLAGSYARMGKSPHELQALLKDAGQAVGEIKDADAKVPALSDLAVATGNHLKDASQAADYLKTAEEAAGTIELAPAKVAALAKIAAAYGQLSMASDADRMLSGALEFARSRSDPREKATSLASVWTVLVGLKRTEQATAVLAEARQIAEAIPTDESRGYALVGIAQKCSAAGQKGVAGELLTKAQAAAEKVTDSSARRPLTDEISRARSSL